MLGWDPTADPAVVGFNVYYGASSRNYTNVVDAGNRTTVTISNLLPGVTYWFAATSYSATGLESDYSAEASYLVPVGSWNLPPTLDKPADVTIYQDAGNQTVNLSGISSGAASENQTLTVSAFSGNTQLIPNPTVNYSSPSTTGTLIFASVPGSFGACTITVMVDDGGAVSNTVIRTFNVTVNPTNATPFFDAIADVTLNQDSGPYTVGITGISPGAPTENQTLSFSATSSNPALIPNPRITYTSPSAAGTLTLTPATNAYGSATITVVLSDGQPLNSTFSRTFGVSVRQVVPLANLLTNTVVSPLQPFRFVLSPPVTNAYKFSYTLDPTAPEGSKISTKRNIPAFVWVPSSDYASTTNLIKIIATDNAIPPFTTNLYLQVAVRDYVNLIPGSTVVQAGSTGSLPIALDCSDGVTNLSFQLNWPASRLADPSLSVVSTNTASGSVQIQGANLLVRIQALPRKTLEGSNLVARLNFRTLSAQSSAFVPMSALNVTALKPVGSSYYSPLGQNGEVVVVSDTPLLRSTVVPNNRRDLLLYGRVGLNYQVQYSTASLGSADANWTSLLSYPQTNLVQTLSVDPAPPVIFYRLKQL